MGERRRDGELEDGMGSKGCLRLPGLGEVRWPLSCHPKTVILPLVTIQWRYNQYCMVLHYNLFSFLCVLGPGASWLLNISKIYPCILQIFTSFTSFFFKCCPRVYPLHVGLTWT